MIRSSFHGALRCAAAAMLHEFFFSQKSSFITVWYIYCCTLTNIMKVLILKAQVQEIFSPCTMNGTLERRHFTSFKLTRDPNRQGSGGGSVLVPHRQTHVSWASPNTEESGMVHGT